MIKKIPAITATPLALSTLALAIYAHDVLACSLVGFSDFEQIEKNIYVAPTTSAEEREQLLSLVAEAKDRVAAVCGRSTSTPVIMAARRMASLKWFSANEYASAKFLPGQSYIVVGPRGHSVDVIAHELVHAQIFEHAGYWVRSVHIPVWFDEGAAMQVDYRKKYDLLIDKEKSPALNSLQYSWQFFKGYDVELTNHYALAKAELRSWLANAGDGGVQALLKKVKSGENFDDVYRKMRINKRS